MSLSAHPPVSAKSSTALPECGLDEIGDRDVAAYEPVAVGQAADLAGTAVLFGLDDQGNATRAESLVPDLLVILGVAALAEDGTARRLPGVASVLELARPLAHVLWDMETDGKPADTPERRASIQAALRAKAE